MTLEDDVAIGPGVMFTNDRHPRAVTAAGALMGPEDWTLETTRVGAGAIVGANATILCGLTIGAGARIAAGSVVTRDVPPGPAWPACPPFPLPCLLPCPTRGGVMIGIGVIGYGYFGPNIARCAAEANGTTLKAIADPSPAARARAAARHPGVTIDESWQRMLTDPEIDAVAIATPTRLHYEIALAALMAGKHVLVEKPITPTSREAARLVAEAAKRRLTLMVDHTFVYTARSRRSAS